MLSLYTGVHAQWPNSRVGWGTGPSSPHPSPVDGRTGARCLTAGLLAAAVAVVPSAPLTQPTPVSLLTPATILHLVFAAPSAPTHQEATQPPCIRRPAPPHEEAPQPLPSTCAAGVPPTLPHPSPVGLLITVPIYRAHHAPHLPRTLNKQLLAAGRERQALALPQLGLGPHAVALTQPGRL